MILGSVCILLVMWTPAKVRKMLFEGFPSYIFFWGEIPRVGLGHVLESSPGHPNSLIFRVFGFRRFGYTISECIVLLGLKVTLGVKD